MVATKRIVRYQPPNEIVGQRTMEVRDWERIGIFTQTTDLHWVREKGWWLDADEANISDEALAWLRDEANADPAMGLWKYEEQTVPDAKKTAAVPEQRGNQTP